MAYLVAIIYCLSLCNFYRTVQCIELIFDVLDVALCALRVSRCVVLSVKCTYVQLPVHLSCMLVVRVVVGFFDVVNRDDVDNDLLDDC